MIKAIGVFTFKSYDSAILPLASLTLLIGANASGKTNCIEALRFLSRLAHGQRIDDVIEDVRQNDLVIRGKITDIVYDRFLNKEDLPLIGFGVELAHRIEWPMLYTTLSMQTSPMSSHVIHDEITQDWAKDSPFLYKTQPTEADRYETQVVYNNFRNKKHFPAIPCSNRQSIFTQLDVPSRFATPKAQKIIPAVVTEFQQALRNIIFLDLNPRAMVDYSFIIDHTLKPDGRNLSSVLYHICETQGRKAEVLAFIGELPEQRISDVGFLVGPRQEVMVTLTETFGHTPVTREAPLLSDGTLRVLAVAAALLSAPTGGLVVIEEIDNGVHPSRAKALLANILAASKANSLRVLLTSHNPALLDTLPKESVPDVVCCYRDPEQGDSRLVRLADLTDYPDLVARGPLGQLMTQGLLDRYLKNQRTPEQKAEQAQEWLRQLQLEDEEDAA
jgi:predicted ATPase